MTQIDSKHFISQNSNPKISMQRFYLDKVKPYLQEKYSHSGDVAKVSKIVLSRTYKDRSNSKGFASTLDEFSIIAGQKGIITHAKKSIASFGITKSDPLGMKVTLRRKRMYAFLDRLIHLSLPRMRDFQGLNALSFDGYGNYNFGLDEQLMFPELNAESIESSQGLNITIVTTAKTDEEGFTLLKALGMPFKNNLK